MATMVTAHFPKVDTVDEIGKETRRFVVEDKEVSNDVSFDVRDVLVGKDEKVESPIVDEGKKHCGSIVVLDGVQEILPVEAILREIVIQNDSSISNEDNMEGTPSNSGASLLVNDVEAVNQSLSIVKQESVVDEDPTEKHENESDTSKPDNMLLVMEPEKRLMDGSIHGSSNSDMKPIDRDEVPFLTSGGIDHVNVLVPCTVSQSVEEKRNEHTEQDKGLTIVEEVIADNDTNIGVSDDDTADKMESFLNDTGVASRKEQAGFITRDNAENVGKIGFSFKNQSWDTKDIRCNQNKNTRVLQHQHSCATTLTASTDNDYDDDSQLSLNDEEDLEDDFDTNLYGTNLRISAVSGQVKTPAMMIQEKYGVDPYSSLLSAQALKDVTVKKLECLWRELRRLRHITKSIQFIKKARVPIIKMMTHYGFETDIAVAGNNGTDTSLYAAKQVQSYKR
jgi:hypothetical protein